LGNFLKIMQGMEKCTRPLQRKNPLGPLAGEKECLCLEVREIAN
jgi:hypothetical protein